MRRTLTSGLAVIALGALERPARAGAQDGLGDAKAVKPVLMLMVDTSGSMERMPVTDQLPACTPSNPSEKNRWTGALEALTGSYTNYTCDSQNRAYFPYQSSHYDYGYYLPHIAPKSSVTQTDDGVLDILQGSVKFGLMTFDGQGTYQEGDPLISWTSITSDPDKEKLVGNGSPDAAGAGYTGGAGGLYSYGPLKPLSFPGCETRYGMNQGARGPDATAGALVSVGTSDDSGVIQAINNRIQSSLLSVRPYGGTPIAAVLDDLKYWLDHSPDLRITPGSPPTGDVFASCRQKYALLLTDGAPDSMFRDSRYACEPQMYGAVAGEQGLDRNGNGTLEAAELCAGGLCECPYDLETRTASDVVSVMGDLDKLPSKLDRLYVVAFNVSEAAALASLDGIATSGNHGTPTAAVRAETATDLRAALNGIFESLSPKATSRTVPITVDGNTGAYSEGARSYEVRAGFRPNALPEFPWDGILERTVIGCNGTAVDYVDNGESLGTDDQFQVSLNTQVDRQIYTVAVANLPLTGPRGTLRAAASTALDGSTDYSGGRANRVNGVAPDGSLAGPVAPDGSGAPNQSVSEDGTLMERFDASTTVNPLFFGDADNTGGPGTANDRLRITKFLDGSLFPGHSLADIYHSNPVALGPLVTQGVDARLADWRSELLRTSGSQGYLEEGTRPLTVFVGSNDGLLHAFNLDTWGPAGSEVPAGHEFWSFFPPALFDKVHTSASPTPVHQFMFDGDIVVKDMFVNGSNDSLTAMRTILLAAVRGAPAYVALDVTTPEQPPKLLWQFSDASLGNTVARPVLTQLSFEWTNGLVQERAVAILPGGRGVEQSSCTGRLRGASEAFAPDNHRKSGRCFNHKGRALFVVDVATGYVIQSFDQRHFAAPLTGSIGIDETRSLSPAAYFTDEDGVLWRLSLDATDPADWRVEPIWDVFHADAPSPDDRWSKGRPSLYPPLITRDKKGNNVIVLGTGDVDNLTDSAANRVVSLTEVREVDEVTGKIVSRVEDQDGTLAKANWEVSLGASAAVTGPLSILQGVVYFSTFAGTSSGDACELGQSYLWGADYLEREGSGDPVGRLLTSAPGEAAVFALKQAVENNKVVLGLSVGKDPLCLTGSSQYNQASETSGFVATGAPANNAYQVRANMGSMSNTAGAAGSSALQTFSRSVVVARKSKVVGWAGSVE